jgi:hypothetical protein
MILNGILMALFGVVVVGFKKEISSLSVIKCFLHTHKYLLMSSNSEFARDSRFCLLRISLFIHR